MNAHGQMQTHRMGREEIGKNINERSKNKIKKYRTHQNILIQTRKIDPWAQKI